MADRGAEQKLIYNNTNTFLKHYKIHSKNKNTKQSTTAIQVTAQLKWWETPGHISGF